MGVGYSAISIARMILGTLRVTRIYAVSSVNGSSGSRNMRWPHAGQDLGDSPIAYKILVSV